MLVLGMVVAVAGVGVVVVVRGEGVVVVVVRGDGVVVVVDTAASVVVEATYKERVRQLGKICMCSLTRCQISRNND